MRKVIVVAVREYQASVRTKAFIISLVVMPIFMFGSIVIPRLLKNEVDLTAKRISVLDPSGVIFDALAEQAERRNQSDIFEGEGDQRKQIAPRYVLASPPSNVIKRDGGSARVAMRNELTGRL